MKIRRPSPTLVLLLVVIAPVAHASVVIETANGSEVSFGGRLQTQYNYFDNDVANLAGGDPHGSSSEADLRKAKFSLKGKHPDGFSWGLAYDANAEKWEDVKAKMLLDGDGRHALTVGQHKPSSGLETMSSGTNRDFIAKASINSGFATGRRLGVSYAYAGNDHGVTANCFDRHKVDARANGTGCAVRGTIAPINIDGHILHFGISHVRRSVDDGQIKLSVKPNADLSAVKLVDTGALDHATNMTTTGLESFWTQGPIKLQGEYMRVDVDRRGTGVADFRAKGGYLSALWNVTGEGWSYKAGVPGTADPADPASGMWQLGVRYDTIDLDDGAVAGGRMNAVTAGVNWYWGANFKFALNHVMVDSKRNGIADNPAITEASLQFHW